jgi:diguanylate cyclase (GGDEF)-like protein
LFARQEDPYAGADLALARRMAAILAGLGAGLMLVLWPFSPIDRQIGDAGWLIGGATVAWGAGVALTTRAGRIPWSFEALLAAAYTGVVLIALVQWLAGGHGGAYERLLLLPLVFVAATNPARRILPLLAAVGTALAMPLFYAGWEADRAGEVLATLVLWSALAFVVFTLMSGIRAQRLALRSEEARARDQARKDDLTGIGNRRAFEETIGREVARATRMRSPLSMAMIDLISFKRVNDQWSHIEGDRLLCCVAETIRSELRAYDTCFRWGGDEFAVIFPGSTAQTATEAAERLCHAIAAACTAPDGAPVRARYGVAELEEGMSGVDLVAGADLALTAPRTAT